MPRVVGRSFVGIRGGCLVLLLWVLESVAVAVFVGSIQLFGAGARWEMYRESHISTFQ
jgi:hypothetical protein